nr:pleckstrin homology domain-containing family B member 1 [Columba livia]
MGVQDGEDTRWRSATPMALVKSGWLWRQSSILRRWKRNWFVLYLDGSLVYYHDETQRDMDSRIHVKYSCRDVRAGRECRGERSPKSPKLRSTCAFAHLTTPKLIQAAQPTPFHLPTIPRGARCVFHSFSPRKEKLSSRFALVQNTSPRA